MTLTNLFTFIGGIGLFLLGMRMMTEGLKQAAGNTLREMLISATRNRLRGVLSGVLITAMVQSSSAVIFATVGFVNAGLLTLGQSIGIIYGSNVGTTLTSWLVAVVGFNVNLQAFALPAIGIGTGLWVLLGSRRWGAVGQAIAGLGLFFLGIDILKNSFADSGDSALLAQWADAGLWAPVLFLLGGIAMTVIMQSSSAALAVTLTAAAGGLVPLPLAATMVIGANIGTTSTALFAIIGATPAAKRAALAHVTFNVITGAVAIATLPLLLALVEGISSLFGLGSQPAILLAIFHTTTKLLGLLVMWPLSGLLVRQLEKRFTRLEAQPHRPQHLDRNLQGTPNLALDALAMELQSMATLASKAAALAISSEGSENPHLDEALNALETLNLAVSEYAAGITSRDNDSLLADTLPHALRVSQYLLTMTEQARELNRANGKSSLKLDSLQATLTDLNRLASLFVQQLEQHRNEEPIDALEQTAEEFDKAHDHYKHQLLMAGARGHITPTTMARCLEQLNALKRLVSQGHKAARYLSLYQQALHPGKEEAAVA